MFVKLGDISLSTNGAYCVCVCVPLKHMASAVNTAVIQVLAKYVNHLMEIVHMVE
jgi:hypothetical protein